MLSNSYSIPGKGGLLFSLFQIRGSEVKEGAQGNTGSGKRIRVYWESGLGSVGAQAVRVPVRG